MYDLEDLLDDVEQVLKDNFNTKLGQIDTEKNDSIVLAPVSSDEGYFLQTLDGRIANANPIIYYSVADIESVGKGPATGNIYQIEVVLMLRDAIDESNIGKRMFRYSRALKEVFEEQWATIGNGIRLKILSLVPIAFTELNTSQPYRAVGVRLEAGLA